MNHYLKLSVTLLFACVITACSKKEQPKVQEKIIPVKVIEIDTTQHTGSQSYVGTAEESTAVSLSFSQMGTVEEVFVQEGQKVRKGELLASINTVTAMNAYQAAQASLKQAQDAYDRLVKVYENGSLPEIKFVEVQSALQQAKSMVEITKKALDDCKLYAPRHGVIASRKIEAGTSVMPGLEVIKLVSVDKINIKVPIPENEISHISEGQTATIEVPALNNAVFNGKIEMKGVAANPISRTYDIKIGINNTQSTLMPGMVCKVLIINAGEGPTEIVVPNRTIQISAEGKRYVWLAENDKALRRFVTTGYLTDKGITITEGLSVGDKLILEGYQKLGEGLKISIQN